MFVEAVERSARGELEKMTNWGRWGKEDERGSLNLISLESMQRGFRAVKTGKTYPLGQQIRQNRVPLTKGLPPNMHFMTLDGGDFAAGLDRGNGSGEAHDFIFVGCHGATTHIDGLGHVWVKDTLYNGFHRNLVRSYGCLKLGIDNVEGIVTRGVLLDVAGYKNVPYLSADHFISADELEECARKEGVTIARGDVVLIRTGWRNTYAELQDRWCDAQPGIGSSAALWLAQKEIVAAGSDNLAVQPIIGNLFSKAEGQAAKSDQRQEFVDVHGPLLNKLGIYLMEIMDLERLAGDKVYDFLFCLAPLMIKGGTGSPINPLAVA